MYIHYYYSIEKGADDEQAFDKRIANLHKELLEDKLVESHKKAYEQFFEVKTTPKQERKDIEKISGILLYDRCEGGTRRLEWRKKQRFKGGS